MAGDYFEEDRQQQMDAAVSLLQRKVDAGEFPDNEDTVKAFAAGWYGVREFDQAKRLNQEAGSTYVGFGLLSCIVGSFLLTSVGLVLFYEIPIRYPVWYLLVLAAGFYTIMYCLVRRGRRLAEKARQEFDAMWLPLAKKKSQELTLTVDS